MGASRIGDAQRVPLPRSVSRTNPVTAPGAGTGPASGLGGIGGAGGANAAGGGSMLRACAGAAAPIRAGLGGMACGGCARGLTRTALFGSDLTCRL